MLLPDVTPEICVSRWDLTGVFCWLCECVNHYTVKPEWSPSLTALGTAVRTFAQTLQPSLNVFQP